MKKSDKTVVYVVDFLNKKVLMKETLSNKSSKKEDEAMARLNQVISELVTITQNEQKKAS